MNYQGRRRRRRTGSSRTSLVMQNFNSGDWGGPTCRGVMSAIDWSAVGCLGVSPHWHSLILRWRERGSGGEGCAGKLLLAFFFFSPFFWEGSVTDLPACWPRLRLLTVKCKRQLITSLPRRDTHTSARYNIMTHTRDKQQNWTWFQLLLRFWRTRADIFRLRSPNPAASTARTRHADTRFSGMFKRDANKQIV